MFEWLWGETRVGHDDCHSSDIDDDPLCPRRLRRTDAAHRQRTAASIPARAAHSARAASDDHHAAWGRQTRCRYCPGPGLAQLAPREGLVAVFPEGRGSRWNWFPPGKESAKDVQFFQQHGGLPDDVSFLKSLVADLVRRGVSDPKRIYLSGLSLGGVMALRMACVDAGSFAAIGLLISAMAELTGASCQPAKPLPILMINGTADQCCLMQAA